MTRTARVGALVAVIGATAAVFGVWLRAPAEPPRYDDRPTPSNRALVRGADLVDERADADRHRAGLERRIEALAATVAREVAERQRLEERIETLTAQLGALRAGPSEAATMPDSVSEQAASNAAGAAAVDYSVSAMERALAAAGIDAGTAADMKRRRDELSMQEMYLRDQAQREQWMDSPRFAQEMAAIEAQRTPVREEIGDDAYDRYLFALGHLNRVRIDEVLLESPAAQAGLQTGDMILRYGDARIFAPDELVAETRGGMTGEAVRLQIIRNGERLEIEVPRGPLGLHIAATQADPSS